MLDTKRYTWRHNNLLNCIVNNVDKKVKVYSDLDGWEAPGGGTIPPALSVTNLKPDIVILDEHTKNIQNHKLIMCLINEQIEQDFSQDRALQYATDNLNPFQILTIDSDPLTPISKPVFYPFDHLPSYANRF